ncbi:hypothetical protein [Streptomyces fagopyri]|uniref:hypothetical protein n=1 Tax=Streptomyces fagopyri TaxID=2662397 RepID=UPI0037136F43
MKREACGDRDTAEARASSATVHWFSGRLCRKEPAQGASRAVLLDASLPASGVTGRHFEDNQEAPRPGPRGAARR